MRVKIIKDVPEKDLWRGDIRGVTTKTGATWIKNQWAIPLVTTKREQTETNERERREILEILGRR